jgi:hypothetical protein
MKKTIQHLGTAAIVCVIFLVTAFSSVAQDKTLCERLGGRTAIEPIVKDAVTNMLLDRVIQRKFAYLNVQQVTKDWPDIVCQIRGDDSKAPKIYKLPLTENEWNCCMGDILQALNHAKVPEQEQKEFLEVVKTGIKDKYFIVTP